MKNLWNAITSFWSWGLASQGIVKPQLVNQQQITPLFLPSTIPIAELQQGYAQGLRRMALQVDKVNQLSLQLESAMAEMKAIATEVNHDWRALQFLTKPNQTPQNICRYQVREIPHVQSHHQGTFTVTSRPLDLFQAEREAATIAQILRHRQQRKLKLVKG